MARQHERQQVEPESEKLGRLRPAIDRRDELCVGHADVSRPGRLRSARGHAARTEMNSLLGTRDSGSGTRTICGSALLAIALTTTISLHAQTASSPAKLPTELSNIRFNSGQS